LVALKSHHDSSRKADELVFQALIESAGDPTDDRSPPRPEGVYSQVEEQPTFSKMMATLVDQVKKEVDEKKSEDRFQEYIKAIQGHHTKVKDLQKDLLLKLAELEKEDGKKITSDSIHTGFDSSHVSKAQPTAPGKNTQGEKLKSVEVLNPGALNRTDSVSSGAEADVEEDAIEGQGDEDHIEPTKLGKEFARIRIGDYKACLNFISQNPDVVAERETDGLLVYGFNSQLDGKAEYAKQCIHQALLLQYCRQLGRDGVGLFFKRITTPGHQARQVFLDDVNTTYARIRTRAAEIAADREADAANGVGVEQIQLHAVDPGTTINIKIPPKTSEDAEETAAREVFDSFPPGLQRALESGSLDEVNKVLGKMSVEEAEEIVGQLGEVGGVYP
jgi:cell division cycle protein 37